MSKTQKGRGPYNVRKKPITSYLVEQGNLEGAKQQEDRGARGKRPGTYKALSKGRKRNSVFLGNTSSRAGLRQTSWWGQVLVE